jgi:tRNA threonylcarbamoyladenosine biosynthesis protein TsaB
MTRSPMTRSPNKLLLAVDTSSKNGSISLARVSGSENKLEVLENVGLTGGTFSAQLIPQVAGLLVNHGFNKNDLAGFAVVSGPGSFTGLRVGLAAVKALAEILHKPIAAISLLEAIARSGDSAGRIYSAIDAGRGEAYVGDYEIGVRARMRSERLLGREEFFAMARDQLIVTPDAGLAEAAGQAGCRVQSIDYPRADVIARLGWERIRLGETVQPEDLEANYIRRSDAEIFSKPGS